MITLLERDPSMHPPFIVELKSISRPYLQTLSGVTSFRDDAAGTTMASLEQIAITPEGVDHRIGELGAAAEGVTIRSDHPEVIRYLNQVNAARAEHQHRLARKGKAS